MPQTVLIADDDHFIRKILRDLLEGGGFRVIEAADGLEACRLAREHTPDAIFLDLIMPNLDGAEACRQLRGEVAFRHTPILMLTSRLDLQGAVNPFQIGADDYLPKPFDGPDLLARLQGNLAKKEILKTLETKAGDYQALFEIADSAGSSRDTAPILQHVVHKIASHVEDVVRCSIAVIQRDEKFGHVLASSDVPDGQEFRIDLANYPEILRVMQDGRPLLIKDVQNDPLLAEVRPLLAQSNFNTMLVLPIHFQGEVIGVMIVRAARAGEPLRKHEIAFCQLVADVCAGPLQNARFLRRTCEESEQLRRTTRRLEQELHIKAVYEHLFDNASEGLAAINPAGDVVYANQKALEIVGLRRVDLAGQNLRTLLGSRQVARILGGLRQSRAADGTPGRFDVSLQLVVDRPRIISVSLSEQPVAGELLIAAFRDVTERRAMERELVETKAVLEAANRRLEKLDKVRVEFLNTATHELRVPVTIVHGYCSLFSEMGVDNLTEQQREFLAAAHDSSEKLVDLVNQMLDLSRFEAGKMQLELATADVSGTVSGVCREMQALAGQEGLELRCEIPERVLASYDPSTIERVLVNLLGNAIKFTPEGGRVQVSLSETPGEVRICVEDTGKGIPADGLDRVFEEFSQVGREDAQRGTGLGLAISKKIVESHGGRIWVESTPGLGSRFSFSLPKPT